MDPPLPLPNQDQIVRRRRFALGGICRDPAQVSREWSGGLRRRRGVGSGGGGAPRGCVLLEETEEQEEEALAFFALGFEVLSPIRLWNPRLKNNSSWAESFCFGWVPYRVAY